VGNPRNNVPSPTFRLCLHVISDGKPFVAQQKSFSAAATALANCVIAASSFWLRNGWNLIPRQDPATIRPTIVKVRQLLHLSWMAGRNINQFGVVGLHIVKFPILRVARNQFPFSNPHCAIAFMLPKQRSIRAIAAMKNRQQTSTFHRQNRVALVR
jgi:hypothetical protein